MTQHSTADNSLSGQQLFFQCFGRLASIFQLPMVDARGAEEWVSQVFAHSVLQQQSKEVWQDGQCIGRAAWYVLREGLIIMTDWNRGVTIYYTTYSFADAESLRGTLSDRFSKVAESATLPPAYSNVIITYSYQRSN